MVLKAGIVDFGGWVYPAEYMKALKKIDEVELISAAFLINDEYMKKVNYGYDRNRYIKQFDVKIYEDIDEMIQKGWGIGSGISLFILAGVSQRIVWDSLYPFPVEEGGKSYGALVAFFQSIIGGEPIWNTLLRPGNLPNMLGLITIIAVFLIVIYLQGVKVELPVAHAGHRGFRGRYPINLLYVDKEGRVWVSSQLRGGLRYSSGDQWVPSLTSPLPMRCLATDRRGKLWAGGVLDGLHVKGGL